jgi:DNA-binding CsgD family transcriptional regulator
MLRGRVAATVLTSRELQVLVLLVIGHADKQIAHELGISVRAVRFHVAQCRLRLGCVNRTHLGASAVRNGYVTEALILRVTQEPPLDVRVWDEVTFGGTEEEQPADVLTSTDLVNERA